MSDLSVLPITKKADDALVQRLESLLEEARNGSIVTLFYVKIGPQGEWTPGWSGRPQSMLHMAGILESLKWELFRVSEKEAAPP
jgi:hypothetical protein